jgi:hypothetical protein
LRSKRICQVTPTFNFAANTSICSCVLTPKPSAAGTASILEVVAINEQRIVIRHKPRSARLDEVLFFNRSQEDRAWATAPS